MLTAELEFLPGKQLQPPHSKPEEEFQFVIEATAPGRSTAEYPLKAGDLCCIPALDWHGIRNSGEVPLKFFVFKWRAKGVAAPERPAG